MIHIYIYKYDAYVCEYTIYLRQEYIDLKKYDSSLFNILVEF